MKKSKVFDYFDKYENISIEEDSDIVVGAIVEYDRKLLLINDPKTNQLFVPTSGFDGSSGSLHRLQGILAELDIGIAISSLFAVFENEETGQQFIYYRATAESDKVEGGFWAFDDIPYERFYSDAIRTMIRRYVAESARQSFGEYFGSARNGAVNTLPD